MHYATADVEHEEITIAHLVNEKWSSHIWSWVWLSACLIAFTLAQTVYATHVVQLFCNNNEVNAAADNRYIQNKSERNSFWWLTCVHKKINRKKNENRTQMRSPSRWTWRRIGWRLREHHIAEISFRFAFSISGVTWLGMMQIEWDSFSRKIWINTFFFVGIWIRSLQFLRRFAYVMSNNHCAVFVFIASSVPRWSAAR